MIWSEYQQAIFTAVRESEDSLIIEAVAGSGKTSTIVEAINHVPKDKSVLFLAFNKPIADTLQARLKTPNAKAMTLHSCGFSAWKHLAGCGVKVNGGKISQIIRDKLTWGQRAKNPALAKLVGLAKQEGIVPMGEQTVFGEFNLASQNGLLPESVGIWDLHGPDTDDEWERIREQFEIEEDEADIGLARKILKISNEKSASEIDFDDMLYLPIVAFAPFKRYDVVFVDESQDTNRLQREMIARLAGGSRVIAVGDKFQSIYAFRGASFNAMQLLQEQFKCRPFPLSITYRCPKAIVTKAQTWVPHIEAASNAEEGVVRDLKTWDLAQFKPGDAVLCRITRPLVALAFHLIRNRIPCRVTGKDIGAGLVKLVQKAKLPPTASVVTLAQWAGDQERKELKKLVDDPAKYAGLQDKYATLRIFIDDLPPGASVDRLILEIRNLFEDPENKGVINRKVLTLSSIHKSKGLEYDRVFVLDAAEFMPPPWATDLRTEANLAYVAATRARKELYYVSSEGLGV